MLIGKSNDMHHKHSQERIINMTNGKDAPGAKGIGQFLSINIKKMILWSDFLHTVLNSPLHCIIKSYKQNEILKRDSRLTCQALCFFSYLITNM